MQPDKSSIPPMEGDFAQWMLSQRRRSPSSTPPALKGGEIASVAKIAVTRALENFKALLAEADHAAIRLRGDVPTDLVHKTRQSYRTLCDLLNQAIGDRAPESDALKAEVGLMAQRDLLPYVLLTDNAERWYSKPRGYAGDFHSLEKIYENRAGGIGRLGPLLDRCFLELPATKGVRNRRKVIAAEIAAVLASKEGGEAKVTSLACGGAREIFDAYLKLVRPGVLTTTLIDMDFHALAHVSAARERMRLCYRMTLLQENLLVLALGGRKIDLTGQDLVYSLGFIEYFNDTIVIKLLDWIHGLLRAGGRVLLGSFHPDNPCKAMMDHVFGWKPVHRTEADMDRLFSASAFGCQSTRLLFEEQRVCFFAECMKRLG